MDSDKLRLYVGGWTPEDSHLAPNAAKRLASGAGVAVLNVDMPHDKLDGKGNRGFAFVTLDTPAEPVVAYFAALKRQNEVLLERRRQRAAEAAARAAEVAQREDERAAVGTEPFDAADSSFFGVASEAAAPDVVAEPVVTAKDVEAQVQKETPLPTLDKTSAAIVRSIQNMRKLLYRGRYLSVELAKPDYTTRWREVYGLQTETAAAAAAAAVDVTNSPAAAAGASECPVKLHSDADTTWKFKKRKGSPALVVLRTPLEVTQAALAAKEGMNRRTYMQMHSSSRPTHTNLDADAHASKPLAQLQWDELPDAGASAGERDSDSDSDSTSDAEVEENVDVDVDVDAEVDVVEDEEGKHEEDAAGTASTATSNRVSSSIVCRLEQGGRVVNGVSQPWSPAQDPIVHARAGASHESLDGETAAVSDDDAPVEGLLEEDEDSSTGEREADDEAADAVVEEDTNSMPQSQHPLTAARTAKHTPAPLDGSKGDANDNEDEEDEEDVRVVQRVPSPESVDDELHAAVQQEADAALKVLANLFGDETLQARRHRGKRARLASNDVEEDAATTMTAGDAPRAQHTATSPAPSKPSPSKPSPSAPDATDAAQLGVSVPTSKPLSSQWRAMLYGDSKRTNVLTSLGHMKPDASQDVPESSQLFKGVVLAHKDTTFKLGATLFGGAVDGTNDTQTTVGGSRAAGATPSFSFGFSLGAADAAAPAAPAAFGAAPASSTKTAPAPRAPATEPAATGHKRPRDSTSSFQSTRPAHAEQQGRPGKGDDHRRPGPAGRQAPGKARAFKGHAAPAPAPAPSAPVVASPAAILSAASRFFSGGGPAAFVASASPAAAAAPPTGNAAAGSLAPYSLKKKLKDDFRLKMKHSHPAGPGLHAPRGGKRR